MTKMIGGFCAVALLLTAAVPTKLHAQDGTENVLGVIQFPPLKTFSDQLMQTARQVMPGQEVEMFPLLFLGGYGYPSFPGVSPTEPVTVFLFDSDEEGEMPFVVMTKVSPDSPMRRALTAQPSGSNPMALGMRIKDEGGWTLISDEAANFDRVTDLDALAALAGGVEGFDVTARLFIGPKKIQEWSAEMKAKAKEEHVKAGGEAGDESLAQKQRYIEFISTIGEHLEFIDFGLDLNNDAIGVGSALKAISGTPEFDLLSAPSGSQVPAADYVSADAAVIYASYISVDALEKYYEVLHDRAMKLATPEGQEWLKQAASANRQYFAMMGPDGAGSLSFVSQEPVSESVVGGKMKNDAVVDIFEIYYDQLFPQLMDHLGFLGLSARDAAQFDLKTKVAEIDGQTVNAMRSSIKTASPVATNDPDGVPEPSVQTDETYFAVVDGNLLTSSTQERLARLVKAVVAGKPVADSVSSRIQLPAGRALAYHVNFKPLIEMFLADFPMQSQSAKEALRSIKAEDLQPATGAITLGRGQGKLTFSVPISSIVKLSAAHRKIEQGELEAQTFGPEGSEDKP